MRLGAVGNDDLPLAERMSDAEGCRVPILSDHLNGQAEAMDGIECLIQPSPMPIPRDSQAIGLSDAGASPEDGDACRCL